MSSPLTTLARVAVAGLALATAAPAGAQTLDSATLAGFRWRPIGPANFSGRVSDIVGIPGPSKTFFVASAAGGIFKTTNNGTTFRTVFDNERVVSMGALAIAPSDTMQVWAGTGEQNSRNSIEPGGGIYKSTDGGLTWRLMGLERTEHIGRVAVHPSNPNIVFVAALGAAWRTNPERGLYRTTDGGRTWTLAKFINDSTGFVDVIFEPGNPNVLYAASYQRIRGPWFLRSGGRGSALWKSEDGGTTWREIRGGGFPTTMLGRISFDIARSQPRTVYAMVEADTNPNPRPAAGSAAQKSPSGLYRSDDAGATWRRVAEQNVRPFYYSQVRVDPRDPERVYWSSTPVMVSSDGGRSQRTATQGLHVDHHAMWIDPNDPDRLIVGNDGGIGVSFDKGGSYDFVNTLPIGQFYAVSYDFEIPYNVCGGLQDNGSWCGPSRRKNGPITNAYWYTFNGGDGFVTASDPTDANIMYGESQGGNVTRYDRRTAQATRLRKPDWRARYRMWEDSMVVARGDTARPETPEVRRRLADFRARQRADSIELDMRYNWNTPFFLSPHNPSVLYMAGNRVLKSTRRGDDLYPISADLSKRQMDRIEFSMRKTGGITLDATGAETWGTATALAESPVKAGWLYVGYDDGNVHMTRNDGATWENITGRFPGLPDNEVYVSRIEPSRFDSLTFYVTFDNHRRGDFKPYVYATTDGGRTFRSIAANLPTGGPDYVHVIREDPVNRDLLYVGTSVGVYVSLDRGGNWQRFTSGFPTVPVYDLRIHPRDRELIAGTHGRSVWVVDVAPLQQMNAQVMAANAHLFAPKTAVEYAQGPAMSETIYGNGHQVFMAPSPTHGAEIVYRVAGNGAVLAGGASRDSTAAPRDSAPAGGQPRRGGRGAQGPQARIVVTDAAGDTVRTLTGPARPGMHRVTWDLRGRPPASEPLSPSARRDSIAGVARMNFVLDSLANAGLFPVAFVPRVREMLTGGDLGAFFRGGAAQGARPGEFVERPGEGPLQTPGQQRQPGERPTGTTTEDFNPQMMLELIPGGFRGFQELLRVPGARTTPDFGGGRGGARVVSTGDYRVTVIIGNTQLRQTLRVENLVGNATSPYVSTDDEEHERQ